MAAFSEDLSNVVTAQAQLLQTARDEIAKVVVGQRTMVDRLLLGLIADGHILLEGVPGLAKTTAVKAVARCINTQFSRIQFTPDLLPADLLGTQIYRPQTHDFTIKKGPVFTNLLLADEINRAPAKVQSALLEAMQEKQVTIADTTFELPKPFLVLATQNPIEQEGTYPLPEAQVDRFMLKLQIEYPDKNEEKEIMRRHAQRHAPSPQQVLQVADVLRLREIADAVYIDAKVEDYIVDVVFATREPARYKLPHMEELLEYGASPRASIFLAQAAKVTALMAGRAYVTPQDVKNIGPDVLRHRLLLSFEAEARELNADNLLREIFNTVDVP